MPLRTRLTQLLSIEHPVLLAPMDVVSDARLTTAVSAAGGLGLLGGGYGEAAWLTQQLQAVAASGQRFGVGFITWSLQRQPELLEIALRHRPSAVMLSFGDPGPLAEPVKRGGAILICQVQSIDMARTALDAGADVLVAQGAEAGGHGCSRGLMTLLPEVVDAAHGHVPVVAAGGIADGRGLAAALMLGASGVLVGTRFYAAEESAAHPAAKQRVCRAGGDDTVRSIVFDLSRRNVWPAPFNGRCLRNAHARRWLGHEVELLQAAEREGARYRQAREAGDFDIAAVIAGEAVGLVKDVLPADAIVRAMVRDAESRLGGGWRENA